jgi:hypothetical protein
MPPDLVAELLGSVNAMRTEMDRRFGGLVKQVGDLDAKIDGVCDDLNNIKTARAIEAAKAEVRNQIAIDHSLAFRYRVGIAVAAGGAIITAIATAAGPVLAAMRHP